LSKLFFGDGDLVVGDPGIGDNELLWAFVLIKIGVAGIVTDADSKPADGRPALYGFALLGLLEDLEGIEVLIGGSW
jgi:hypothetical protein